MEIDIDSVIEYGTSIEHEFNAKLNRIRYFVHHSLTTGTTREMMLRSFLSELAPRRYEVGQGFICNPIVPVDSEEPRVSRQCDILVYDRVEYPLIHSEGEVRVVWPESVRIVIEVKSSLDKEKLDQAMENLHSAKRLNFTIAGMIFAFNSTTRESIVRNLQEYRRDGFDMSFAPNAIMSLGGGFIIFSNLFGPTKENGLYDVREATRGTLMTLFFLLFLRRIAAQELRAMYQNSVTKLIEERTERVGSLRIGEYT